MHISVLYYNCLQFILWKRLIFQPNQCKVNRDKTVVPKKPGLWTCLREKDCTQEELRDVSTKEKYYRIWDKWHLGEI